VESEVGGGFGRKKGGMDFTLRVALIFGYSRVNFATRANAGAPTEYTFRIWRSNGRCKKHPQILPSAIWWRMRLRVGLGGKKVMWILPSELPSFSVRMVDVGTRQGRNIFIHLSNLMGVHDGLRQFVPTKYTIRIWKSDGGCNKCPQILPSVIWWRMRLALGLAGKKVMWILPSRLHSFSVQ